MDKAPAIRTAGPDLDALVAEKVCGWTIADTAAGKKGVPAGGSCGPLYIPAYSTDIEAAMRLVEDLRIRFRCMILIESRESKMHGRPDAPLWHVVFWDDYRGSYTMKGKELSVVEAPTLPHAIALAALRIVGL